MFRPAPWRQPVGVRPLPPSKTAALAGLDFDTATGWVFGDLAGGLTSLARQTSTNLRVEVMTNASPPVSVATSGTLTTDANGRLGRWTNASLAAGTTYLVLVVRLSDGEPVVGLLTAT